MDLPSAWKPGTPPRAPHHNLGLLLRWSAALSEIRAYRGLPRSVQHEILATFGDSVLRRLGRSPHVELMEVEAPPEAADAEPQEALPTVFSFSLHRRSRRLGLVELRQLARLLGAQGFHLGQPVALGSGGPEAPAVLRVAIGAPLVCSVAIDPRARIPWLDAQLGVLVSKLDAILGGGAEPS